MLLSGTKKEATVKSAESQLRPIHTGARTASPLPNDEKETDTV